MKTIAVLGAGALAKIVVRAVAERFPHDYQVAAVAARTAAHAEALAAEVGAAAETDAEGLLRHRPDLVIEVAGGGALKAEALRILEGGADLVAVSVGAFSDRAFLTEVEAAAKRLGRRVYIPNGAVGGLDLLQTYAMMPGAALEIENVKAPKSLAGAPGLEGRVLRTEGPDEVVFEGGVADAIAGFPKNVNVAVAASLAAGVGDAAKVRVVSRPGAAESVHRIRVSNAQMHAELSIASKPDPANPRSSTSTAWSVVALLKQMASPVVFF